MTASDTTLTDALEPGPPGSAPAPVPLPQQLLDDISLLLAIGLVVPTLIYIVWGLMELASVPVFTPAP
jgi:hypothetical protein